MAISLTVITTASRARRFLQTDAAVVEQILDSLKRSGQIFSGKPLIIGSSGETEVFSAASIACIEVEAARDLGASVPNSLNLTLTAMTPDDLMLPFVGSVDSDHVKARIDFFFIGGHVLRTRAEGTRKAALAERLMNLTSLFERPVINYRLPHGGVGLINPQALTRILVTPAVPDLPRDAWLAEPA